jgi:hypothetical protein
MVTAIVGLSFVTVGVLTAFKPVFNKVADAVLKSGAIIPVELPPEEKQSRRDLWRRYARWLMPGMFLLVGGALTVSSLASIV